MQQRPLDEELDQSDIFYPVATWPVTYRRLFYKPKLNYRQRYILFLFFWLNGMQPQSAAHWVLARGIRMGNYEARHISHLRSLVAKTQSMRPADVQWRREVFTFYMEVPVGGF